MENDWPRGRSDRRTDPERGEGIACDVFGKLPGGVQGFNLFLWHEHAHDVAGRPIEKALADDAHRDPP